MTGKEAQLLLVGIASKGWRVLRRLTLQVALMAVVALVVAVGVGGAAVPLLLLSTDPYSNSRSQHQTEVEPDTFAFGSTIVSAFQVGRFKGDGASNVGWATSTNGGSSWANGFLPGTTKFATPRGPYARVSDPSVAYDAKHDVWIITAVALTARVGWQKVIASRSLDGALTWQGPVTVATGSSVDKEWIVCDNTPTSPFYGNCYVEWDDNGFGNRIEMNTSSDGGLTWGPSRTTADSANGLGGQPLVRPSGTVVVPISSGGGLIFYFTSTDGGASWSPIQTVALIYRRGVAGHLRTSPLPSAEIDRHGRVFVAWQDCRFRSACSSGDIVYAVIEPTGSVTAVKRVPIDPLTSTIDHFIPGLAVDKTTGGSTTHLALTYYYYPVSNCGTSCELHVGFVSSSNNGSTWTAPTDLAGPMDPSWLADTSQGRMVGDYISTSFVGSSARTIFAVANPPSGSIFDEAMYTPTNGLLVQGVGTLSSRGEQPVGNAASDHPPPAAPPTAR